MPVKPLAATALYTKTDLRALSIKSTEDLEDIEALIGQERALGAVRFATRMRQRGYNLFVIGPKGSGKHMAVSRFLEQRRAELEAPSDWVYVHNFENAYTPSRSGAPCKNLSPILKP